MGTRGYWVHRYRNMYFAHYNCLDSHPISLGVGVLESMRLPHAIAEEREKLERILAELTGNSETEEFLLDSEDFTISSRWPQNDLFIEWIYEIDLDRNVLHVNGIPFFDLECLPDEGAFLTHLPYEERADNYANIVSKAGYTPEHLYKRPGPPVVDDSDLATYQSSVCTGAHVALSDLLVINDALSPDEQVRVSLLEMMVGQCMVYPREVNWVRPFVGQLLYNFELVPDHNQLTNKEWSDAFSMANFAFVPQFFDAESEFVHHHKLSRKEFTWVREDTVVCIATHLYDKRCLQASISRLIAAISKQKDVPGDYFGVAFSVHHCAIVKVVKDGHTTMFSHTPALQFLPSIFAESPSTSGITALARLGYRVDPALFVRVMEFRRLPPTMDNQNSPTQEGNDALPNISFASLPPELLPEIALHLDLQDLLSLGLVSKLCREVASMVLRYPHVCGHRLVAVPKETPAYLLQHHRFLYAASFSAARAGIPTNVLIGLKTVNREVPTINLPFDNLRVYISAGNDDEGEE